MIIAGFGCRPGAPASDFDAALATALGVAGCTGVTGIAIPRFRATETGLMAAIDRWDLPVAIIEQPMLEQACARAETHSALALKHTGLSSVAESAALAATGADSRLIARRVSAGSVTCAIATGIGFP